MTDTAAPTAHCTAQQVTAPRAAQLLAGLVDDLLASGALAADWRPAFLAVPRHLFVPDLIWHGDEDGDGLDHPVRRSEQPDTWLELVYRDEPVVTQINDEATPAQPDSSVGVRDAVYTSSSSMPTVSRRCSPHCGASRG